MKRLYLYIVLVTILLFPAGWSCAAGITAGTQPGAAGHGFTLADIGGKAFKSQDFFQENKWVIYYFFDIESSVCRKGLRFFNDIQQRYAADVSFYAITAFGSDKLTTFLKENKITIPVLMDEEEEVSELYKAMSIFPTTYVLNGENTIVEMLVGSSGTVQSVMTAVIDKHILKGNTDVAQELLASTEIQKEIQGDTVAQSKVAATQGYASLKAGDTATAKNHFQSVNDQVVQLEGEAAVAYKKGDKANTEKLIERLLAVAPDNTYAHTLRAKLLFKEGKVEEAMLEYEKAVDGTPTFPWQKAEAANNLGRTLAKLDKPGAALASYDKSLSIYPENVVPLSNKGVTLNRAGNYSEASKVLEKAKEVAPRDQTIKVLIEKNDADMAFSKDFEKQRYVQTLVNRLVAKYKAQQAAPAGKKVDEWTSRALTMSFLPFEIKGNDPDRDGDAVILYQTIEDSLKSVKRGRLVERRVIDKLLEELEIGSSALASKKSQLRLGKILAARILLAADIHRGSNEQYYVTVRAIDTETSEVVGNSRAELAGLNQLQTVEVMTEGTFPSLFAEKYPFQCKIVSVDGAEVIVNIGENTGLVSGISMEVIEQGKPVIFDGEILGYKNKKVGTLTVQGVQEKMAFASVASATSPLKPGMLCKEK